MVMSAYNLKNRPVITIDLILIVHCVAKWILFSGGSRISRRRGRQHTHFKKFPKTTLNLEFFGSNMSEEANPVFFKYLCMQIKSGRWLFFPVFICMHNYSGWRVQDYAEVGTPTLLGGGGWGVGGLVAPNTILPIFVRKLPEIKRIWQPGGGGGGHPP